MPPPTILASELRRAVELRWAAEGPDVPTAFAGAPLEADALPAWCELWAALDAGQPARGTSRAAATVTAHVFARESPDCRLAEQILDQAAAALAGKTLPLPAGHLRLREPEVRDLTRDRAAASPAVLRHLVLTIPAVAEAA